MYTYCSLEFNHCPPLLHSGAILIRTVHLSGLTKVCHKTHISINQIVTVQSMDFLHREDWSGDGYASSNFSPYSNVPPSPSPLTSSNPVRNVIPYEKKATRKQKQHPAVNEVREYVEHFKSWRSGANIGKPVSPEVYENNLCIKIPMKDWLQLGDDLNIFETDEKFLSLLYRLIKTRS